MKESAFLTRRQRHDHGHGGWEMAVRTNDLAVGQRVRITSGPLLGLQGVVTAQSSDGKWVLEIPESAHGVLLCIRGHQLTRAE